MVSVLKSCSVHLRNTKFGDRGFDMFGCGWFLGTERLTWIGLRYLRALSGGQTVR